MASGKAGTVIIMHLIGWLLFLSLPIIFLAGQSSTGRTFLIITYPYYWVFVFCYALLFYSHTYYFFPEWFEKKKYVLYGLYIILFITVIILVSPFDKLIGFMNDHWFPTFPETFPGGPGLGPPRPFRPPNEKRPYFDIISLSLFFLTLALSIAVIYSRQLRKSKERALQAETKKAKAELSFLKAQIHPHFLFNTLNNIYSLATNLHENTAPAILKLSNILRYVTEEITEHFVPLTKEISCIRDYIDLQQLRLSNKTTVDFVTEGNFENARIPPMILMTFIENAFKFGISNHEPSVIEIRISVTDGQIDFFCQNKKFHSTDSKERNGIGLTNTRQRLHYLYRDKYKLHTEIAEGLYTVRLLITSNSTKNGGNGH